MRKPVLFALALAMAAGGAAFAQERSDRDDRQDRERNAYSDDRDERGGDEMRKHHRHDRRQHERHRRGRAEGEAAFMIDLGAGRRLRINCGSEPISSCVAGAEPLLGLLERAPAAPPPNKLGAPPPRAGAPASPGIPTPPAPPPASDDEG